MGDEVAAEIALQRQQFDPDIVTPSSAAGAERAAELVGDEALSFDPGLDSPEPVNIVIQLWRSALRHKGFSNDPPRSARRSATILLCGGTIEWPNRGESSGRTSRPR